MIEAFSLATAHLFQDALALQARLRYDVFVQRRRLAHDSFEELEFGEFDTPAAISFGSTRIGLSVAWRGCCEQIAHTFGKTYQQIELFVLEGDARVRDDLKPGCDDQRLLVGC